MTEDKLINLQMQVKQNNAEMIDYINDLNSWEEEIKNKENQLKNDQQPKKNLPPPRSRIKKKKSSNEVSNNSDLDHKRIKSLDYKAWEKFDVACEEADKSENETDEAEEVNEVDNRVETLREKGNEYFKQGRHSDAIGCYTQALLLDPCNSVLFSNRAMANIKLERYALAEDDCTKAIDFDSENVKAYMRRGRARQFLKKYTESQSDYKEALQLEPQNKFCKECLQEVTRIVDSINTKVLPDATEEQGIVKPITKPPSERSKKPLQRVIIEEVEIDCTAIPASSHKELQKDERSEDIVGSAKKQTEEKNEDEGNSTHNSMASNAKSDIINKTLGSQLTPPSNSYQFQVDWAYLKDKDAEFFQYFKAIEPKSYRQIFGEAFDSDILSKIVSVLHQYYYDIDLYSVLEHLPNIRRFSMNFGFLSPGDKHKLEEVFVKLSGNKTDCDIGSLRSLYT